MNALLLVAGISALIASTANADERVRSKTVEVPELGVSINLPGDDLKITRSKDYFRAQNYGNVDPKDGLPPDLFYVEMVRQTQPLEDLIKPCGGKQQPLPKLKEMVWCKLGPVEGSSGDSNATHAAFMKSGKNVIGIYVGGALKDAPIERILKSIKGAKRK